MKHFWNLCHFSFFNNDFQNKKHLKNVSSKIPFRASLPNLLWRYIHQHQKDEFDAKEKFK